MPLASSGVSSVAISTMASGLPWVASSRVSTTRTWTDGSRARAEARSRRPWSRRVGSPATSGATAASSGSGGRIVSRIATDSARSRRAAKRRASVDDRSSHCRSSIRRQSGPPAATTPRTAAPRVSRPAGGPTSIPSAVHSAVRWCAGRPASTSGVRSGPSIACSPACGTSRSAGTPTTRTCRSRSEAVAAASSSVDLPTPASPWITRTPAQPDVASTRRPRTCAISASRPITPRNLPHTGLTPGNKCRGFTRREPGCRRPRVGESARPHERKVP